jgi:hypothetical protein
MRLQRTTLLACEAERLLVELRRPALLHQIAAPMLVFVPVDPDRWPEKWEPRQYRARLRVGGWLPIGDHTLDMDSDPSRVGAVFHDAGFSKLIKVWDHQIVLTGGSGQTRYTDRVTIKAGLLTPAAWLFAWVFYRHRQRRLRRLVSTGFGDAI